MIKENTIVSYVDPKSPVSEAYRVLRTNLRFAGVDKQLKTIELTSTGPAEGKSTTAANLAVTIAQAGSKVLLVDADMRKPKIHQLFGLVNGKGLTNVLANKEDYNLCIKRPLAGGPDVLTSGPLPPNPSEILSSESMKEFIERVGEDYDMVLFDTPPIGVVTDAAILSTLVDGTLLVVASSQADKDAARRAKDLLEHVKANIIGVVLNKLGNASETEFYYASEEEIRGRKRRRRANG